MRIANHLILFLFTFYTASQLFWNWPSDIILIIITSSQGCDLPEQSTVHVVLPPSGSSSSHLLLLQERLARAEEEEEEQDSLTKLDLSSQRLQTTSAGLAAAAAVEGCDGGAEEVRGEAQAAGLNHPSK